MRWCGSIKGWSTRSRHQLVPDEGDAQDLAQETFLAAWRAIDRCPPGYEKQWLARIASNKAKDYLRSAWVRRVNTPGDDILALEGAPPGSDPEQQVLDAMTRGDPDREESWGCGSRTEPPAA